jgi:hypothetical protein
LRAVAGDGRLDVSDVVLALRTAVGLEALTWPERDLRLRVEDPVELVAFSVAPESWPAWARAVSIESPWCDDTTGSGLETDDTGWAVACALDPAVVAGPADLFTLHYRAARPVAAEGLTLRAELLDSELDRVEAAMRAVAP